MFISSANKKNVSFFETFVRSFMYIKNKNDLVKVSKKLTFFLFADDTNIYYESSNILDIQKTVNKELRKVRKWLEANRLALNIDKTNFVIFSLSTKHT